MKNFHIPDISMPDIRMPDVSLPDVKVPDVKAPDFAALSDSLFDFAGSAADAISSAAGHVPGLHDYRASSHRRDILLTVGAIAAVLAAVAIIRRRRQADEQSMSQSNR